MTTLAPAPDHPTFGGRPVATYDGFGIMERLLEHRREQGGTLCEASGIQGCGKTTWLLNLAQHLAQKGEVCLWRGRDLDAWHAFPGPVKVWAQRDRPMTFAQIAHDANDIEAFDIPVHPFEDAHDLIPRLEAGVLNVVYAKEHEDRAEDDDGLPHRREKTRFWDKFVYALVHRTDARWIALFVDEFHELWGDRPQGDDWHAQRAVRDTLADFRKSFCSLYAATHHYDECDEAILKKFQFHAYLRGARIPSWSVIRNKNLADTLRPGEAIVVSGNFAKVLYPNIPRPPFQLKAIDALAWPDAASPAESLAPVETPPEGEGSNRTSAHAREHARARVEKSPTETTTTRTRRRSGRGSGAVDAPPARPATPEDVRAHLDEIADAAYAAFYDRRA